MEWYAASIIVYVKFDDENQNKYPVWENVILVSGDSDDEALDKASDIGKESDGDDFEWEGRPATWKFAGVRKLMSVDFQGGSKVNDGMEVTFSQMLLKTKEDLVSLVDGDEVALVYEE